MGKKKEYLDPRTLPEWARSVYGFCFGGDHHWGNIEKWGYGFKMNYWTSLATWDSNHLTKLVLIGHQNGVRVEVVPIGPRIIGIAICQRPQVEKIEDLTIMRHHPTMEQHKARLAESLHAWKVEPIKPEDVTK